MSEQDLPPEVDIEDRELQPGWYRHPAFVAGHGYWNGATFVEGPS